MKKFSFFSGYAFGVAVFLLVGFVLGYILDLNWFEVKYFEGYITAFAGTGVIAAILSLKE